MFHIDPIDVLNADYFDWCVRVAAYNAVAKDKERVEKEQIAKQRAAQYKK